MNRNLTPAFLAETAAAETDEERGAQQLTHTEDGRRFATPIRSAPCSVRCIVKNANKIGEIEHHYAWRNALTDGIAPWACAPPVVHRRHPRRRWYVANAINRQHSNAQYLFREIDLRGVGIQQQKLGYRKAQVKEFPLFVKSATSSASVMCGGGGGSGVVM